MAMSRFHEEHSLGSENSTEVRCIENPLYTREYLSLRRNIQHNIMCILSAYTSYRVYI